MSFWKDEVKIYDDAYLRVDDFFESLYLNDGIMDDKFSNLRYREGQHSYSLDIMEAIRNREILLVEAGVGIGKSFGYLLPIFYTMNSIDSFNKVIISTSSIALQEQLLRDIKVISDMLGIEIKADIAKGVNNYACLKRIHHLIGSRLTIFENKKIFERIIEEIEKIDSSDKSDLEFVSESIWKYIQLQSRGYCSNCSYSKMCPFYKKQHDLNSCNIIITNHANMIKNVMDHSDLVQNVDMIVFDEVHKLEENMRNLQINEFKLANILVQVDKVAMILDNTYEDRVVLSSDNDDTDLFNYVSLLKSDLKNLFSSIRASASKNYFEMIKKTKNEDDYSITEASRLGFRFTPTVVKNLEVVLRKMEVLFQLVNMYEKNNNIKIKIKELLYLKQSYLIFMDMLKKEDCENIYWTNFYKENKISLCYVPKNNLNVSKDIFSNNIPIICTSGTMLDDEDSYRYFSEGIELSKITSRKVSYGDCQKSPYNYDENSLFYYNPNLASPKEGKSYILDLASEISELIRMTEGKALILFTSKETMNSVYNILIEEEFPFEILLHTDNNTNEVREHFSKDTNSCLFATGAFWEGIDVKGKSLSNLIITHLPFDQVDAITQYKASKFSKKEQFREVYFPNMLIKFKQAVGRLIRSDIDTGIVCCLDSRFDHYKDTIIPSIPIKNCTTNLKQVYEFVEDKILDNKNIKTKHLNN